MSIPQHIACETSAGPTRWRSLKRTVSNSRPAKGPSPVKIWHYRDRGVHSAYLTPRLPKSPAARVGILARPEESSDGIKKCHQYHCPSYRLWVTVPGSNNLCHL